MPIVSVNGTNLYYELHGPQEAPVVVLNNGVIMNAATSWAFQTRTLASHLRLLQYDCRGQGQSDHPAERYSMELHAADLAALLDALEITQAHIAGISYGGEVAQAFALAHSERVQSLFLADTVSEVAPDLALIVQSWIEAARRKDADAFFQITVPWNFSPAFIAANPALLEDARQRYRALDFESVVQLCEAFLQVSFTDRLAEIKAPACIVYGELDLLKGAPYARILKQHLPQAEIHPLPGAGHATVWEAHQEFNSVLLGFVVKHSQARARPPQV
jgi:3-oxoadipate enol-lactonase